MAKATLTFNLGSRADAEALAEALSPDSEGFVDLQVAGSMLTVHVEADSTMGLLRTLDDVLTAAGATDLV